MKNVVILAILVLGLILGVYVYSQVGPKDPNDWANGSTPIAVETVSFCGKEYEVETKMLFGIDTVKRIAELATLNPENGICENIAMNDIEGEVLRIEYRHVPEDASNIKDYINILVLHFGFDPKQEEIYIYSGFDGSPTLLGSFE